MVALLNMFKFYEVSKDYKNLSAGKILFIF